MTTINVKFDIINELSIIFLWVGIWGILDQVTNNKVLVKYKMHINLLLIYSIWQLIVEFV
jgi:hypothetical protein